MEVTITKQCLAAALLRTANIADRKSSMQILSNVLIDASSPEHVRIAATDLNLSASGVFPAQVSEGGALTLPAKTFHDVIKNMPEGPITISTKGEQIHISSGRSKFMLLGLPAEDFPMLPSADDVEFFELDAGLVTRMIEQTSFSISNDDTRPYLNGALFQGDGKNLRMVTTDGHRLSKVDVQIEESGFHNFSMVVPNKGIMEIRRLLEDGEGIVSLAEQKGSIFLKREVVIDKEKEGVEPTLVEFMLVSKLIESEFPPYSQVIPSNNDKALVIDRTVFLEALRRVSVVSSDRTLGVKFCFQEGSLTIESSNPSIGEGKESIDVNYEGDVVTVGFNARYFIDILSVLGDDEIVLEMSGELDPMIVKDQSGTFIGVVMPMRI